MVIYWIFITLQMNKISVRVCVCVMWIRYDGGMVVARAPSLTWWIYIAVWIGQPHSSFFGEKNVFFGQWITLFSSLLRTKTHSKNKTHIISSFAHVFYFNQFELNCFKQKKNIRCFKFWVQLKAAYDVLSNDTKPNRHKKE